MGAWGDEYELVVGREQYLPFINIYGMVDKRLATRPFMLSLSYLMDSGVTSHLIEEYKAFTRNSVSLLVPSKKNTDGHDPSQPTNTMGLCHLSSSFLLVPKALGIAIVVWIGEVGLQLIILRRV